MTASSSEVAALGRDTNAFTGNDFTGAELDGVAFHDIDLRAQRLPGLPGHALIDRVADRVRATLALVERWPDERHRDEARRSLEFLARHRGDEALVTPRDLGRKLPPALRQELFEAIRRRSSDTSPDPGSPPREPGPEAP
ncbi:hypothetical protein [Nonomuraea soli]|uniref:Uncharacterized protein n=1 Tax=Nonomuraea soli TaxID=1032476 RepID=A0A7W0CL04_9ACTN|nr:hypothetical protein [Nonomuraea soli]MBA2893113.1 hypothetical protein [Nonomuraea soli]